jgi:glucokinase
MVKEVIISIDAGGTYHKSAVVEVERMTTMPDSVSETRSFSLGDKERVLSALFSVVSDQIARCRAYGDGSGEPVEISRIVFDFPGPFNYREGYCMMNHKFTAIYGVPLEPLVREHCHVDASIPIFFHHDLHAFSYGVYLFELKKKAQHLFCVSIGTGLGTGFVQGGQIVMKPSGDPRYPVFQKPYGDGILEDYVSNRGLVRMYETLTDRDEDDLDAKRIQILADRDDDPAAKDAYARMGSILGEGIHSLVRELEIDTLIIGGQVAKGFHLFGPALEASLSDLATLRRVKPTESSATITMLGAASMPTDSLHRYGSGGLIGNTV